MAIDPVKIPQNVYVEDRIIGPITLRQLIIVLLTGGLSYAIWGAMKSANGGYIGIIGTIIAWIPCGIGAAFAFVKIQGISLMRFCLLLIEKSDKPSIRKWTPRKGISINFHYVTTTDDDDNNKKRSQAPHHEKILELSAFLDRGPVMGAEQKKKERKLDENSSPAEEPLDEADLEPLPVDPTRVSASPREEAERPLNDITPQGAIISASPATQTPRMVMHDIFPPTKP